MYRVVQQFNSVGLVVSLQLWPVDSSVANVDLSLKIRDCRDFHFDQQVDVGFYLGVGVKVNLCVAYLSNVIPPTKFASTFLTNPLTKNPLSLLRHSCCLSVFDADGS